MIALWEEQIISHMDHYYYLLLVLFSNFGAWMLQPHLRFYIKKSTLRNTYELEQHEDE